MSFNIKYIIELIDEFSPAAKKISQSIKNISSQMKKFEKVTGSSTLWLRKLKTSIGTTSTQMRSFKRTLTQSTLRGMELQTSLRNITESVRNLSNQLSAHLAPSLDSAARKVNKVRQQVDKSNLSLLKMAARLKKVGTSLLTVGKRFSLGLTLPLLFAGRKMIKMTATFDQSMARITARSSAGAKEISVLRQRIIQLSSSNIINSNEIAKSADTMSRFGLSIKDTIKLLGPLMEFAVANAKDGIIDLSSATKIAIRIKTAYGKSLEQIPRLLEMITNSSQKAGVDLTGFYNAMKFSDTTLKAAHVSFAKAAAAIGVLAKKGVDASRGGRGLQRFMTELINPVGLSAKLFKALNLTFVTSKGKFIGLANATALLNKNFKQLALFSLFTGQGVRIATAFTQEGAKSMREYEKSTKKTGLQQKLYTLMTKSLAGRLIILNNSIRDLSKTLIESVIGPLTSIIKLLTTLAHKFSHLSKTTKMVVVGLAAFGFIFGPLLMGIASLTLGIAVLIRTLPILATFFTETWAAALGPIALIIAGIVAAEEVLNNLYNRFKLVREIVDNLGQSIENFMTFPTQLFQNIQKNPKEILGTGFIPHLLSHFFKGASPQPAASPLTELSAQNFAGSLKYAPQEVYSSMDINVNDPSGYIQSITSNTQADDFNVALGSNMALSR